MMIDLFDDKSKSYYKIKGVILKPNVKVDQITSELDQIKDLKDQKSVVDFLIREQLLYHLQAKDIDRVKYYLNLSIDLLRKELVNTSLPFLLFSDVFNSLTIQSCELFFSFMEECVMKFKDTPVFGIGRTMLLRICNDLLRRLSKSQDTVFCGKIQIFLSRLFPLDEKSGLNLMGHFNTENFTPYLKNEENDADGMTMDTSLPDEVIDLTEGHLELGECDEQESQQLLEQPRATRKFYQQFWQLQDYFRCPTQCYESTERFNEFQAFVDEVVRFFSKFRVSSEGYGRRQQSDGENDSEGARSVTDLGPENQPDWSAFSTADMTFTKYLTSERLFDLQLLDINFRRGFLVQLAVMCQYFLLPCKFRTNDQTLTESQKRWVTNIQAEVMRLVDDLSSKEEPFNAALKQILDREEVKCRWKNEGCPSFVKKSLAAKRVRECSWSRDKELKRPRIVVGEDGIRKVSFGNQLELTRLWSLCPDNMEACRKPSRTEQPDLYEYFSNAREELKEYQKQPVKTTPTSTPTPTPSGDSQQSTQEPDIAASARVNDERWAWSALRLLSRHSPHFYTNWPVPGQTLAIYLTKIITEKLDAPSNSTDNTVNNQSSKELLDNSGTDVSAIVSDDVSTKQSGGGQGSADISGISSSAGKTNQTDEEEQNEVDEDENEDVTTAVVSPGLEGEEDEDEVAGDHVEVAVDEEVTEDVDMEQQHNIDDSSGHKSTVVNEHNLDEIVSAMSLDSEVITKWKDMAKGLAIESQLISQHQQPEDVTCHSILSTWLTNCHGMGNGDTLVLVLEALQLSTAAEAVKSALTKQ